MIENLPGYVSIIFILTTFLTVGIFLYAVKRGDFNSTAAKVLSFLLPFWLIFQASLAFSGFYLKTDSLPPRTPFFAVLPASLLIITLFIFARKKFISRLPIKILTILHVIRIPVELVLLWLFQAGQIPQLMTFEGRNFDLLSGLTAPLIYWLAFSGGKTKRRLLIVWNLFALGLLINIVVNAFLSFPFSFQQFAFDQPNRAVLYFPFVWLPSIVVPIVLFAHLASLWQLFSKDSIKTL
ncbi:MAG: hypothetical protein AVDCRST_MAG74-1371 [uncultured Pyrinomonadaceae bacterium]|uniref:Uncharacterized protein n=1 Tax=uncultured Pyrinomonadaceae bacterium TaxID=2283094 RepID=A0A6J4NTF7_9BACT|nr:MAG: hypothetical protein AVDCRST_MAG74-1371 [uncultured Pyrinomonadaceae bacterium]